MPHARRFSFRPVPLLAMALAALILPGCGDSPTGPGREPLPTLRATLTPPAGDWLVFPTLLRTAPDGEIYILDYGSRRQVMRVYSPQGLFRRSFPLAADEFAVGNDHLYVMDSAAQRIVVHDRQSGERLRDFAFEAAAIVDQYYSYNLAASPGGDVWIVDPMLRRVQRYSDDGVRRAVWGERGTGPGQFEIPFGIAVDPAGHLVVLDLDLWRVQKFTFDGVLEQSWDLTHSVQFGASMIGYLRIDGTGRPVVLDRTFDMGRMIHLEPDGSQPAWYFPLSSDDPGYVSATDFDAVAGGTGLLVLDTGRDRAVRYDEAGVQVGVIGRSYGSVPGEFSASNDLQVLPGGTVALLSGSRVDRFGPDGRFIDSWRFPFPTVRLTGTADGGLWGISTSQPFRFVRLDAGGRVDREWVSPVDLDRCGIGLCFSVLDLEVDPRGNLVLLQTVTGDRQKLSRISPDGAVIEERERVIISSSGTKLRGGVDLAFDPRGWLWELDYSGVVVRWRSDRDSLDFPMTEAGSGRAIKPSRIGFDQSGRLFALDVAAGSISAFGPSGAWLGDPGTALDLASRELLSYPLHTTFDVSPDGWIAVAEATGTIRLFGP